MLNQMNQRKTIMNSHKRSHRHHVYIQAGRGDDQTTMWQRWKMISLNEQNVTFNDYDDASVEVGY